MRVIKIYEEGGPEVLKLEEAPAPEPAEGEVLVRIEVASVSFADVQRRSGHYLDRATFPTVLGSRIGGTVEKVGPGGDSSLVGKKVTGLSRTGSYAEFGIVPAAGIEELPAGVDTADAISILAEADTAALALKVGGRLQPGESVFVPAATGGIGFLAVQLAQLFGAGKVYGAASSEEKRAVVAKFGATPIDYTKEGWPADVVAANGGTGVDLAFEVNGGQSVYDTLEAVRAGGRMVVYGNINDINAPVNPRQLLRRNQTLTGFGRFGVTRDGLWPEEHKQVNREIREFMVAGKLKPLIGGKFPLADAAKAHQALENRSTAGKVLILPQE